MEPFETQSVRQQMQARFQRQIPRPQPTPIPKQPLNPNPVPIPSIPTQADCNLRYPPPAPTASQCGSLYPMAEPTESQCSTLFPSFSPKSIAGLQVWYDGADPNGNRTIPADGSAVNTWVNKAGNPAYNAVAMRNFGTYSAANKAIIIPGSTMYSTGYTGAPSTETIFVVYNNPSPNANTATLIGGDTGARGFGLGYSALGAGSIGMLSLLVTWNAMTPVGTYTPGTTALATGIVNGSTTSVSANGGSFYPSSSSYTPGTMTWLGGQVEPMNTYMYTGSAMEIIIFSTVLKDSQILQVNTYLSKKWGLNLPLPESVPPSPEQCSSLYPPPAPTPSQCGSLFPITESQCTATFPSLGFSLTSVDSMVLWLDAADSSTLTKSGTNVTSWADKSGSGYVAQLHPTDAAYPITVTDTDGKQTLATGSRMYIPNFNWNNAFTAFVVCKGSPFNSQTTEINGGAWQNYYATGNWSLMSSNGFNTSDGNYIRPPTDQWPGSPAPVWDGGWIIFCIGYNLGTTLSHYSVNGTSRLGNKLTASTAQSPGSNTGNYIINGISTYSAGTSYLGEILHFNSSISVNTRKKIEKYLGAKWGIAIGST